MLHLEGLTGPNALLTLAVLAIVSIAGYRYWRWRHPINTIDELRLASAFHSLNLFGRDGAFWSMEALGTGDKLRITKRIGMDKRIAIECEVTGPSTMVSILDRLSAELEVIGSRMVTVDRRSNDVNALTFTLSGAVVEDHATLEAFVKTTMRYLGHSRTVRYRLNNGGPIDWAAFREYFGMPSRRR